MNRCHHLTDSVFFVGPPSAGKTTLAQEVASRFDVPLHTIDDWAGQVYPPDARAEPMTDLQVDEALGLLFRALGATTAICEFAYHDYVALLGDLRYATFTCARKILVIADLPTCQIRNGARRSQVNPAYVERAWRSTCELLALSTAASDRTTLLINTTATSISAAVAKIVSFLVKE